MPTTIPHPRIFRRLRSVVVVAVTALCVWFPSITRVQVVPSSSMSNKEDASLQQYQQQQQAAFRAFNEVWKQSIGSNTTCFRGEQFGDQAQVTFPKSPHFIIIGAQKAGTTALATLLGMHPLLKKINQGNEAHFFDKDIEFQRLKRNLSDEMNLCQVRHRYYQHYWAPLEEGDLGKVFFEKTPRYMIWPDVPAYIQKVCPWNPKIIALLRNPIDRLYSHHKMNFVHNKSTAHFRLDHAIQREVGRMRDAGLTHAPLLEETQSSHYHSDAAAFALPNLTRIERENMVRNILQSDTELAKFWLMQRGMYAVQLESWLQYYQVGVNLLVVQYERLHHEPAQVWNEIQDFLQVPRYNLDDHILRGDYSPTKSEYKEAMSNTTREYLKQFYRPYNERLVDLLGEEWRGVWD